MGLFFSCSNTSSWSGNLLPGQYVILPGTNSWSSVNTCPQLMGTGQSACYVSAGGSNIYRTTIINVNGAQSDYNISNNVIDCNLSRLAVSEVPDVLGEEPLYIEIYTITGVLLDINKWDELPVGIYLFKEVYTNETKFVKRGKN